MNKRYTTWVTFGFAFLILAAFPVQAQTTQISGTVTDAETGEPLPGVNIRVEATQIGTITNFDGGYQIALPVGNRTLIYTFVGYRTQEAEVPEGQGVVNVQLEEDLLGLDEVVVTGLATSVKRQNLANSVETISARELAGTTTNQTLDGALSGKITGGVITSYTGAPGGGIAVKLRGINTINGESQPLFVVDGVIASNAAIQNGINAVTAAAAAGNPVQQDNPVNRIADLNPEDIESVEILKGASAAAIYGSRASNGVVIITTKKGKSQAGDALGISFSQSVGFSRIANSLGSPDYTLSQALSIYAPDAAPDATPEEVEAAQAQKDLVTGLFNSNGKIDIEDQLYGNTGVLSTTNLSVSGGNDRTQFYLSGLVKDDGGIIERTGYEKQSIRANVAHRISRIVDMDITTNYIRSKARRGITGNDNSGTSYGVSLAFTPNFVDLTPDADGNYPANPFNSSNPLQTRDLSDIAETTNRFITSSRLGIDLLQAERQSLKFVAEAGADFFDLENKLYFPETLQFEPGDGQAGTVVLGKTANLNYNWRGSLVHSLSSGDLFFTTQAGFTGANEDRDTQSTVGQGLIGGQQNVDQASSINTNQTQLFRQDRALYAQEEVNWQDRVIGTVGVRADRSSLNGDPDKYYVFPKASLAVNVAEFDFWSLPSVDQFKLRAAYGETGNTAPFGSRYTTFGPLAIAGITGITINTQRGFADVEPERASEIEGGVDISAFDGSANLELTGYVKTISDLLLTRQVPNSTGFSVETFNGGELRNVGFEAGLTLLPINTPRLRWTSRTSFWTNSAEVTELTVPAFRNLGGGFGATLGEIRIEEGQSPTQIVGIDDRLIQTFDAEGNVLTEEPGQDGTPDGTYQLGDTAPDFQMSFYNDFQFAKRFTLTVFAHWKKGGDNINLSELLFDLGGTSPDYFDQDTYDRLVSTAVDPETGTSPFQDLQGSVGNGEGGSIIALDCTPRDDAQLCTVTDFTGDVRQAQLGVTATQFVQDASYFKLRELGLYYDVPTELLGAGVGQHVRQLRLGFSANNLFVITPYKSYDPEVNNFADQPVSTGVEVTPFPASRSFLFHVSLGL